MVENSRLWIRTHYRVEYIGSLQSDRGYEMSVERSLY